MTEEKLLKLKKKIEESKTKVSELKGKKSSLMDTLKKTWKCDTINQAVDQIESMKDALIKLEDKREKGIKELQENYDL